MIAHYEDTKSNTFFRETLQQLERVKGLCDILESKIMATMKSTPQTLKIEVHIKKKKVKEVKDHAKKEEMNPTIYCKSLRV